MPRLTPTSLRYLAALLAALTVGCAPLSPPLPVESPRPPMPGTPLSIRGAATIQRPPESIFSPAGTLRAAPQSAATGLRRLPPVDSRAPREIMLASHQEVAPETLPEDDSPTLRTVPDEPGPSPMLTAPEVVVTEQPSGGTPIDLANALAMGGASSLEIRRARERVIQAHADWLRARHAILPNLRLGIAWNKHDGRIQATPGQVVQAGRNSLFVGGGAGLGDMPLNGGAGGPPRLMVNFSLADAFFQPRIEHARVHAASAGQRAVRQQVLLDVSNAYGHFVESHALSANARQALDIANQAHRLVRLLAEQAQASQADVHGAAGQQAYWKRQVIERQRMADAAAIELARLLRLEPTIRMQPAESHLVPVALVDESTPFQSLIATALNTRPELSEHRWLAAATLHQLREECARPWLPYIQLGATGGAFGGGRNARFDNQGGRSDVDVLAVWELRNLGLGHRHARQKRSSQRREALLMAEQTRDQIVSEVAAAATDIASYRRQIAVAEDGVRSAQLAYQATLERVKEAVAAPLELFPVIRNRALAQDDYARAIAHYNTAQFKLQHALGRR